MIEIRQYEPSHYEIVSKWWPLHGWPVIPEHVLPKNGLIAFDGEVPLVAGWLIKTDCSIAWIEWFISNPAAEKAKIAEGLDSIITMLCGFAKLLGYHSIHTSTKHNSLIRRLKNKHAFVIADEGATNLLKVL